MFGKTTICCTTLVMSIALLLCTLHSQLMSAYAEPLNNIDNVDAINSLYENLLQREYAGPIIFPSHQMERKAQRSPSLRLRFGRRSDPDNVEAHPQSFGDDEQPMVSMEKRWWGDVNQKPIRSPSLRLRFGKRQLPLSSAADSAARNNYDALMHDLAAIEDNLAAAADYNNDYENGYERVVRKPQRLRWGRSVLPALAAGIGTGDNNIADLEQQQASQPHAEKWRNLLMSLGASDGSRYEDAMSDIGDDEATLNGFQREVRKPGGPLRLRWGRSTGGRGSGSSSASSDDSKADSELNSKAVQVNKSLGATVLSASKAAEQQHQSVAN